MTRMIACVACLDPARSVHTPTFVAAVEIARETIIGPGATIALFDDAADAGTAHDVAHEIVAAGANCVVGHFASAAAAAAVPVYQEAGIPLLLPAATMTALTRHPHVYRVCDNDDDYANWMAKALHDAGVDLEMLASDRSAHGDSVVKALQIASAKLPATGVPATLFAGRYAATIAYVEHFQGSNLVLTDDADAPSLADDLGAAGLDLEKTQVHLAALRPKPKGERAEEIRARYRQRRGIEPGTYFWETIAAIELAAHIPFPPTQPIETVLGPLIPDAQRECRPHTFSLVRVGGPR
jgi:hypothetical protein